MKLAVGPIVVAGLAGVLFFGAIGVVVTWAPDLPVEELKGRWAPPPSRFIEVNGMQVHLRDEGPHDDPAPIVLLHGTSASLHTWQGWAVALREQRRVIRFDLPGFGLTGPNRQNDYSTAADVLFVRAVMDKLGVQRFVLAGNSLGGLIAWTAAAQMPDRVDRADPGGRRRLSAASRWRRRQELPLGFRIARMPWLRAVGQVHAAARRGGDHLARVYGDPSKVTAEQVDLYRPWRGAPATATRWGSESHRLQPADLSLLKTIQGADADSLGWRATG